MPEEILTQEKNIGNRPPGPNTGQKWQRLPLLGANIFAPKFDFSNFSVLTKTVGNKNLIRNDTIHFLKLAFKERCSALIM